MNFDIIYDLDMSANEVYKTIMERINWADKMMEKTNDEGWYIRKLGYEEILDDLLYEYIKDTRIPYFKEPEVTNLDIEMAERIRYKESFNKSKK